MKKKITAKISLFLSVLLVVCLFAGCKGKSDEKTVKFYRGEVKNVASGVVAENPDFFLDWDADACALFLNSRKTGKIYGTIPYDFYQNDTDGGVAKVNLYAPLNITYVDRKTLSVKTASGYTSVLKNGRIASEKIDNGIKVIYYYDKLEISIPVEYRLFEKGLEAKILPDEISESIYQIFQISLLPYMVSVKNSETAYLTVPSGCGGIIRTADSNTVREYSEEVYGRDPVKVVYSETRSFEQSRLPIFGACDGENAVLAVIGNGAASASVEAKAGNQEVGYSGAYATFSLRGYDLTTITDHSGMVSYIKKYSDTKLSADGLSVKYYPLEEYTKDYSGLAECYRDILLKEKKLSSEKKNAPIVSVDILGGAQTKELFFGFPYDSLVSATSINEATDIVKDLNRELGEKLLVNLSGFTESGLDVGVPGGGFKVDKKFGNQKDVKALTGYCKEFGNQLFINFDLVRYSKSANGFNTSSDSVQTANLIRRKYETFNIATNTSDKSSVSYFMLSPKLLPKASEKLVSKMKKSGFGGVSLTTLGNIAYSDYAYTKGHCKGDIENCAGKAFSTVRDGGFEILTSDANQYAALLSDYVVDVPLKSSKYDCIDKDIPLYAMVFKGYIPLYSSAINLGDDVNEEFLRAIECGISLHFSLCADYPEKLFSTTHSEFSASRYSSVKPIIIEKIKKASEYLKAVSGSVIIENETDGTLAHTVFDNGISVYVNYGENAVNTALGTVEPGSFIFGKEVA